MNIKFTRKQYMNGECTFREYYAQFVNEGTPQLVAEIIGEQRLLNSQDEHLNDIPLKHWDALPIPYGTGEKMKAAGTWLTTACCVCINKEAARKWIEANK